VSLATLYSRASAGVAAPLVTVEVHISNGLPALSIVGLPETAVKESKDRVRGALLTGRFEFPPRRITVNLAPADLPKEGGRFDLPIALGVLAASGQLPLDHLYQYELAGELALSGELRPVRGVIPLALAARDAGRDLIVPRANAEQASRVSDLRVLAAEHLLEVSAHLAGESPLFSPKAPKPASSDADQSPDLAEVRGQAQAKRALEVAAAGGHSLLMVGPPGTGKSMLAARLPGLLPQLSEREALETAAVYSVDGQLEDSVWGRRPFRAPHHTASAVALVGGGSNPRPGEISLAHNGVLFLDELPEFDRRVLEVLREPLESGRVQISRAARQAEFPARFQLVAAMNPCPCGHLGDTGPKVCRCTYEQIARYRARISGPLLDRIDLQVEVPRVPLQDLEPSRVIKGPPSGEVRRRVEAARAVQLDRAGRPNALLSPSELERDCRPLPEGSALLHRAAETLGLSARAFYRILKMARTIADLAGEPTIRARDVAEAIGYRRLDRAGPAGG
jgi:magnesium chelatase family protein